MEELFKSNFEVPGNLNENSRYLARPRLWGGQHKTIRISPITARRNKITLQKKVEIFHGHGQILNVRQVALSCVSWVELRGLG